MVPDYGSVTAGGGGGGMGSLNKNTAIVSGPGPPDLIRVCRSCAIPGIPSGDGWGHPLCHFLSADSAGTGLARQI